MRLSVLVLTLSLPMCLDGAALQPDTILGAELFCLVYLQLPRKNLKTDMAIRILLVDDHPVVRQGLKTLLERQSGWEVVGEASDGFEALDRAASLQPDVLVLDITMPRMNGLEACRLIRQRVPGVEILFVTQHDSPQMMREALDAGARGYVVKSNATRDLLEAVRSVSQHKVFTALTRRDALTSS